jgi:hypothetical protein
MISLKFSTSRRPKINGKDEAVSAEEIDGGQFTLIEGAQRKDIAISSNAAIARRPY